MWYWRLAGVLFVRYSHHSILTKDWGHCCHRYDPTPTLPAFPINNNQLSTSGPIKPHMLWWGFEPTTLSLGGISSYAQSLLDEWLNLSSRLIHVMMGIWTHDPLMTDTHLRMYYHGYLDKLRAWKTRVTSINLTIGEYDNLRIWQFQILTIGEYDNLRVWQFESLTVWDSDNLRFWQIENLKNWGSDNLRTCHFGSLSV